MKTIFSFLLSVIAYFVSYGQCSTVSVQVSSSDTTQIQLYHAGFFNIPSGFDNICEWEVISFSGEVIHQETTSGAFNEQSRVLFDHSVPITDSMKATIMITNNTEGIICTMTDTLYWKETEVLPGAFIGNWDVLSSNGGIEEDITHTTVVSTAAPNIELYPSPTCDYFKVNSELEVYSCSIFDSNGQWIVTYKNKSRQSEVDISGFSPGVYFVQIWDENNHRVGEPKKIVKI